MGEGNGTPVFLPGEFHGREPGRLQSMGSKGVFHYIGNTINLEIMKLRFM